MASLARDNQHAGAVQLPVKGDLQPNKSGVLLHELQCWMPDDESSNGEQFLGSSYSSSHAAPHATSHTASHATSHAFNFGTTS